MVSRAEYIWLDGSKPTKQLRSKTRILQISDKNPELDNFPEWTFDGSSTYQSSGDNSDLLLKPVAHCHDPVRGGNDFLVLCEVFQANGKPHHSNTRHALRTALAECKDKYEPWLGFEQEYVLFAGKNPLGWPENGYPKPQGPFYCGVGSDKVFGRDIVEEHMEACIHAGLAIYGINAEVMPGQWEFQIGYRGFKGEDLNAIEFCDQLWLARWLLCRIGEEYNVTVSFDNKPVKGDWNGSGCHTNFSTKQMRDPNSGIQEINLAIEKLSAKHSSHIQVYGHALDERLTGLHETCSIDEFRSGVSDRGSSIRIPLHVSERGYGYLEDRRPGSNCDPYQVATRLITTICGLNETSAAHTTLVSNSRARVQA